MVLLRFAPSPTGSLHLGGLRTALLNHLFARKHGGKWILRIEDTDAARYVAGSVDDIRNSLEWAGLEYDYGPGRGGPHAPYFQSERRDLYHSYAQKLLDAGHAYRCFCPPSRLAATREKLAKKGSSATYDKACLHLAEEEVMRRVKAGERWVVRLDDGRVPTRSTAPDLIFGNVKDAHSSLPTDPVLLKSDMFPTYHLASVVDDHEMGITHVLRGEEWLPSLPLHLDLYACLKISPPKFAHLPLLLNADGSKMSKRKGDVSVADFKSKGWEPLALINWLALAGKGVTTSSSSSQNSGPETKDSGKQAPDNTLDISGIDELIANFDISSLTNRRSILDPGKLLFLNKKQLSREAASNEGMKRLVERVKQMVKEQFGEIDVSKYDFNKIMRSLEGRLANMNDVPALLSFLFREPDYTASEAVKLKGSIPDDVYVSLLDQTISLISSHDAPAWDETIIRNLLITETTRAKQKQSMSVLRHALTGEKTGLGVVTIMHLLGKERTVERLKKAGAHRL